ncbi:hypothetical protein ACN4EG_22155 [Alkalinema pantanalense CENA528]|uniref:hypothetical protein n=1 Tax=Alkalinema pantanalense TaxID=1620705 RepID=UPI003D6F4936
MMRLTSALIGVAYLMLACSLPSQFAARAVPEVPSPSSMDETVTKVEIKPDDEVIALRLQLAMRGYRNQKVMQRVAQERAKFPALAKSCQNDFAFLEGSFGEPFPINNTEYLIPFYCASYRGGRVFQLLRFLETEGLLEQPITIMAFPEIAVPDFKVSHPSDVPHSVNTLFGRPSYQADTRKLTIEVICDPTGGHPSSESIYRYENNQFVLKEFKANTIHNCKKGAPLVQIYP